MYTLYRMVMLLMTLGNP